MGDRAFKHVGEREYVEGIPFGSWMETGDVYVSDGPLGEGDIELAEPTVPIVVGDTNGYGCDGGEFPAIAVFSTREAAQAFIDEWDATCRRATVDGVSGTCHEGDLTIGDDLLVNPPHISAIIDHIVYLRKYVEGSLPPDEWCRLLGVKVMDPDGWRGQEALDWETPISRIEFGRRVRMSTVRLNQYFVGWDKLDGAWPVQ